MSIPHVNLPEFNELQQLVAELTIKHGVERVITQEIFRERVQHYLGIAKKEVEAVGPETNPDSSDYIARATIFGSRGDEGNICVGWREGEKRQKMWALSEVCRVMLAQGVIFRNVMTGANMERIAKAMEFQLPDPRNRQKMAYFEERMWKWIRRNYGRERLAALPPEFRWDGIMVAGFGPKLEECGLSARYWWENGKVHFQDFPGYDVHVELIPRWWQ